MEISILQSNNVPVSDETIEFVRFVCEQAISSQSVAGPKKGEHIERFIIKLEIVPIGMGRRGR